MLARVVYSRVVRVVFYQHHIADVGTTCNRAFKQVMAKHGLQRQAPIKRGVHGAHIEQPLASKSAQAKQVLVQV